MDRRHDRRDGRHGYLPARKAARLEDPDFRADPDARLDFFYRRSPWFDAELCVDPVVRIPTRRSLGRLRRRLVDD